MQRSLFKGANQLSKPAEYMTVVYFCHGAEKAHTGKVAMDAEHVLSNAFISRISHIGP